MKSKFFLIQAEDPYVADLLRIADEKIAELTKEVNVAREERDGAQMKIDSFRQQVLINKSIVVQYRILPIEDFFTRNSRNRWRVRENLRKLDDKK